MAKIKPYEVDPKEKREIIEDLFLAISRLKTKKEIIDFFLGLFTASEVLMIARRIQVAKLLLEEKSYNQIQSKLGASSQMINKTDIWLHDGNEKYVKWLTKVIANIDEGKEVLDIDNYSDGS
ncbi:MAG TPA: hypothetical protein ENJ27_01200, partial [Candidatus Moranbacteria bacterium]|nr:hypothetical protein [Candidatus Moranbacteria bacterium]